jgi:hypothetical protein
LNVIFKQLSVFECNYVQTIISIWTDIYRKIQDNLSDIRSNFFFHKDIDDDDDYEDECHDFQYKSFNFEQILRMSRDNWIPKYLVFEQTYIEKSKTIYLTFGQAI